MASVQGRVPRHSGGPRPRASESEVRNTVGANCGYAEPRGPENGWVVGSGSVGWGGVLGPGQAANTLPAFLGLLPPEPAVQRGLLLRPPAELPH